MPDDFPTIDLEPKELFANLSEQVVLAKLLVDGDAYDVIAERLNESDFYRSQHRLIYQAIRSLGNKNYAIDVYSVGQRLELTDSLARAGGIEYLTQLSMEISQAMDVDYHVRLIGELALRRKLIKYTQSISQLALTSAHDDVDNVLNKADAELLDLTNANPNQQGSYESLNVILERTVAKLEERYEHGGGYTGVPTGYLDLDKLTDGLQKSDLIIIGALPSRGKTALTLGILNHVAVQLEKPVLFFSMEMPSIAICNRLLSLNCRIGQDTIRSGKLSKEEWSRLTETYKNLEDKPFFVDESPSLSGIELRTRVRRFVREHPDLALVAIDYLQLMALPNSRDENRASLFAELTRTIKILAREIDIPIIVLSQLNRAMSQRTDKRPVLSDLRESGAIEQDADLILFLHREDEGRMLSSKADIFVGKHRNGATKPFALNFVGEYGLFENYAKEAYPTDLPAEMVEAEKSF